MIPRPAATITAMNTNTEKAMEAAEATVTATEKAMGAAEATDTVTGKAMGAAAATVMTATSEKRKGMAGKIN